MVPLLWLTILIPALFCGASEPHWHKRNRETIQQIYDLTVFPANAKIIAQGASAVPAGLFNVNATGRVTPVGEFTGFQDSIEYFFGLAPVPTGVPPNGVITKATLVEFTSGLRGARPNADNSTGEVLTALKQIAFWHFDAKGSVLKYDAWIPSLDRYYNVAHGFGFDLYNPAEMSGTIQQICGAQAQTCVGPNTSALKTLTAKPFGRLDEAWGDNVVCRLIHVLLTKLRPEVHCPHVGPTGGGKCIDVAYNDVFFNDQVLFNAPLGKPFHCQSK
ncbi:hypothetical protein DFH09DRAFT_1146150 [Mycena vulgaris]|nr:hypothetical protein DFH09DRAFT_1146150 [Mycena vulgaris]